MRNEAIARAAYTALVGTEPTSLPWNKLSFSDRLAWQAAAEAAIVTYLASAELSAKKGAA